MYSNGAWARSLAVTLMLALAGCAATGTPLDSPSRVGYMSLSVPDPVDPAAGRPAVTQSAGSGGIRLTIARRSAATANVCAISCSICAISFEPR